MPAPDHRPIGRIFARTAKAVSSAFDARLTEPAVAAGLARPAVAAAPSAGCPARARRNLGIQGATLTHHLNTLKDAGLLTRRRDPNNRRVHLVELTTDGDALSTGSALRRWLTTNASERGYPRGVDRLTELLDRIRDNVTEGRRCRGE